MQSYDKEEFISAYNDTESFPNIQEVADYLGITRKKVEQRASSLRKSGYDVIYRGHNGNAGKQHVNHAEFVAAYNDPENFPTLVDIANYLGYTEDTIKRNVHRARDYGYELIDRSNLYKNDPEIIEESLRTAKNLQRAQDLNRIKNKTFRERARAENAVEEYSQELVNILKSYRPKAIKKHKSSKNKPVGVIQLSDIHFNEEVELPNNRYNFNMASARIREHVESAKQYFSAFGITDVFVALTGDLINSPRHADELLMNATNSSKASFIGFEVLRNALLDLNRSFNLSVSSISGNESRLDKDIGYADPVASHNFDYTIFNMLVINLESEGIQFNKSDNPSEVVVGINGNNVLLLHGHAGLGGKNLERGWVDARNRYMDNGINLRYILSGHIHQCHISEYGARSGSTVGNNDYSSKALGLSGRASQNLYLFYEDGRIDSIKVDLQEVDEDSGYDITDFLDEYGTKTKSRLNKGFEKFEAFD